MNSYFHQVFKAKKIKSIFIFLAGIFFSHSAFADAMPWSTPLQKIADDLTGTTAHMAIIISIALGGLGFAMGEHGGILRKIMAIVMGASCAVGAASLAATFGWV